MIYKLYEIFGLSEDATNEQIEARYKELQEKYRKERFLEGEAGNEAAKKLTELQTAYKEIMEYRHENSNTEDGLFKEVSTAIKNGDLKLAQQKLDEFNERPAEWHYLQAVVYYKKNWSNESKKQLEIAMQMDPNNEKYKSTYERLLAKMNANQQNWNRSSSVNGQYDEPQQMGGGSCFDFCCQMLLCNALLNCCCNCG